MLRAWLTVCASVAVAGCNATTFNKVSSAPISRENPGTSVKIKNPDPGKWAWVPPAGTRPGVWVCKPLACSGNSGVAITTGRSPTRNPDKAALEKAAKLLPTQFKAQDLMMEAASEGDERITSLSSKVTSVRDYPAIVAEAKRSSYRKERFILRADIFIGLLTVRVVSMAPSRPEAMKHFESFVAQMDIIDVERPVGGATPATAPVATFEAEPTLAAQ